jgi:nicotinamidase-related amidase
MGTHTLAANLPALIIVDMQRGMADPSAGRRNNPEAEENIVSLLSAWRAAEFPLVHVRHLSRTPGSPFWPGQVGAEFQARLAPTAAEHVVDKNIPDAFLNTGLERWLRVRGIENLVVVGVSTNNSVESTVRTASNLGFRVTVVADATFAFEKPDYDGVLRTAAEVHAMSLANLSGEFAAVARTTELLGAL